MPVCLLVRHGRTSANTSGVLAGWTPGVALDELGRAQVTALAGRLRGIPVRTVVTSPLQRCRETADALAAELPGVPVVEDDGLGECRYGAWTGARIAQLAKEPLWRVVQDQPSAARFPDDLTGEYAAESLAEMQLRAVRAVRRWDAAVEAVHGPRGVWVAVSHGDVIKAVLADAAGTHLDHFQRIVADPASLSAVSYTRRRPFVLRANDVGGDLSRLVPPEPPPEQSEPQSERQSEGQSAGQSEPSFGLPPAPVGDAVVGGGAG